ncbi:Hpt domain-containing protein [Vibrio fluvialis]|uniref:Hpt domain-containing protein n=1 Tax=Vibrio fluvialis TaxID=676 RepID=UPI001ED8D48C|nr:Hpt domain-containing protein [Vibrio fluvialis]
MSAYSVSGLFKDKSYLAVIVVWGAVMLFVLLQYRALETTSRNLNELENSVEGLRNTIYFSTPYRTTRANDLALNIQLIYSLRLQLEADSTSDWFQPDLTQTLYVTDRFIEQTQSFLAVEMSVNDLVERLQTLRERYASQPDIQADYLKIGAYVLQALYTEGARSPELYRTFDALLKLSETLPQDAKNDLQHTLAKVSTLLSHYAEGDNLVDKLLRHRVHNEIMSVNAQYEDRFKTLTIVSMGGSAIAMLLLVGLMMRSGRTADSAGKKEAVKETSAVVTMVEKEHNIVTPIMTKPQPIPQPEEGTAIDIGRMLSSLNDDHDSVNMLLEVFVEDHRNDDQSLRQLLTTDPQAALRKAHSLKGVAGNLGADGLREIAMAIEMKLKQDTMPSEPELQQLTSQLKLAIESARYFLNKRAS